MNIQNLKYIDSLRGIAISLVLIVHSSILFNLLNIGFSDKISTLIGYTQYGVILFFLVSSYTLFRSLDLRKEINLKYFFLRRFFRIAPLYYFIIILLFFTTSGISGYLDSNTTEITLSNLLLHIFFLNGFFSNTFNSIIGVEWTIFVEVWFYMLLPFIYKYKKHINKIFVTILAIAITTSLYLKIFNVTGLSSITIYKSPLIQFLAFIPGCLIYLYEKNDNINNFFIKYKYIILSFIILSFILLSIYTPPFIFIIMVGLFSLFFMLIKNNKIKVFDNKLFRLIGKISYSLYLIHFIILNFVINNWDSMFFKDYNIIGVFLLIFGVIFLLSIITYNLIEVKFMNTGKKIINNIK